MLRVTLFLLLTAQFACPQGGSMSRRFELCGADGACEVLMLVRTTNMPYRLWGELQYIKTESGERIITRRVPIVEGEVATDGVPSAITFPSNKLGEPNKSFALFFSGDTLDLVGPGCNPQCQMHAIAAGAVVNDCLEYQPHLVTLRGTIERKVFPGRPNFTSVKAGDEAEDTLILHLIKPTCVNSNTALDMTAEAERNVRDVQLILGSSQEWKKCASLVGNNVAITGKLFHGFNGHHHTRVLIIAKYVQ